MQRNDIFMNVNLKKWVLGTIDKYKESENWNDAWKKIYYEIGGKSRESAQKGCPVNGAKTLYFLGRIKGNDVPFQNPRLRHIWNCHSKNGVYSILAVALLGRNHDIPLDKLWLKIQRHIRCRLKEEPAKSNQGGPTVAFKLWHLGLIVHHPRQPDECVTSARNGA